MARGHTVPMHLQVIDGNRPKKSNKEISERLAHENKMNVGDKCFLPNDDILKSPVALKQWQRLTKIYSEFEFVNSIDNETIISYCMACSDLDKLYKQKREIEEDESIDTVQELTMLDKLKISQNIFKLLDLKLKYADKLFLTPASRLRSLPRREEVKEPTYLEKMGFNGV